MFNFDLIFCGAKWILLHTSSVCSSCHTQTETSWWAEWMMEEFEEDLVFLLLTKERSILQTCQTVWVGFLFFPAEVHFLLTAAAESHLRLHAISSVNRNHGLSFH